ncbi:MAG: metallophosphoesterase family protein [Lachnospiraceae bacterium]|nr:metallophosphoesterase family protein [Lachnospiraceae bacterium]
MRFAIVSDIHGNLPALNAVIEDAEKNNINCYIFVGDYCLSNPYPDEVISRIRNLDKKYIIRGNEEKYLENLIGKDQSTWTDGQMQISYYCYQKIKHDNLNYLLSMPEQRKLVISDTTLHMVHSSEEFISDCEHREWSTAKVAKRYKDRRITQAAFSADIHTYLNENKQFNRLLDKLDNGVYIFGHTHIQWNYRSNDGKKLLINPGSCGLPLDCVDAGMPYTILDILNTDNIVVEERRVPFPLEEYISIFRQSEQFSKVNVWSRIILKELKTKREHLFYFLQFAEEYAMQIGDKQRPFSISTWEKAYELWEVTKEKGEG